MVEDIILSEIKKKIVKDTYLTLYGILDEHVEKNDKANVGALKHLNGIFVKELIIPVRKKTPYDYIRNFFFFEIMEIHENFLEHHISSKELPSYIFKTKKGKRGSFNFNCIEKCFDGYQEDSETNVKVFQKDCADKTKSSFEETFDYVFLNMTYILDKISENLLKYMRLYWTAVHKKEEELTKYKNKYIQMALYSMRYKYPDFISVLREIEFVRDENSDTARGLFTDGIRIFYDERYLKKVSLERI